MIKEEWKLEKKLKKFLENNLEHTKPHLSLIFKDNNGNLIYKNESSKDELWTYNEKTKKFETIKLNFFHEGSLLKSKKTYYTPNIITKEEDIKISSTEEMTKINQNINQMRHNLILSFLLDAKEKSLETKYIISEKNFILINVDPNNKKNNITKIFEKDKVIKESLEIFENFIKQNKELFLELPEEDKEMYVKEILNNYYKTDLFFEKNLIFYILKI